MDDVVIEYTKLCALMQVDEDLACKLPKHFVRAYFPAEQRVIFLNKKNQVRPAPVL